MHALVEIVAAGALAYFLVLNAIYLVFTVIAACDLTGHVRARAYAGLEEAFASPLTPPVSVLLPAHNEVAGIVESVRSVLDLRYPTHEVIVVNDGSTDGTLDRLHAEFDLVPVRKTFRGTIPCARIRRAYVSRRRPELWVLDKDHGGKADALNAGTNAAQYPYVCAVDADAILEQDALLRVAKPILDDPDVVGAAGGIVRIANGCAVDHGRVVEVGLPRSSLATLQVVEYFRAFLVGRVGWNRLGSLLIISGAFGLFRRSLVETVGGWWTETAGEDVELVVRLHRYLRERDEDYRIEFVADPVCWTEAPEDIRTLARQRRRWQRGLFDALWRHRGVVGRPSYGVFGLFALPFFVTFELLGPVFGALGIPFVVAAGLAGELSPLFLGAFFAASVLLGLFLSVAALALEELGFRRHRRNRDAFRLFLYAVVENFGYRQVVDVWRLLAFADIARGKRRWGAQHRRGIGRRAHAFSAEP